MEKLAIFGGKPVRDTDLYYGSQWIDDDDIQAVVNTLKGRLITCGPKVEEVEEKLCKATGAKYVTVCSNGTTALHTACMALGIGPGDEVITTPITFAASANCALYCGATVKFADINPETYNIDPKEIEKLITPKTKAIVAVDFTGQAVQLDEIMAICKKHNIKLIEDAAHSINTRYKGKLVGSIADITCFSFHPVKTVTAGEGGAVATNDEQLAKKIKLFHAHGITHDPLEMSQEPEGRWYYEMISLGNNYRMTDFQAALLGSQLNKLEKFANRRKEITAYYDSVFSKMPEITLQKNIEESDTTKHLYLLQLNLEELNCTRKEFFDAMAAEKVNCQVHYIPVYWFPYYQKLGFKKGLCPKAEHLYQRIVSIPLYPAMTQKDVDDTVKAVKKVIDYYKR